MSFSITFSWKIFRTNHSNFDIFSRNYFSILAKSDMVKDVGFHTGVPIPLSINSKRIKQKLKKSPTQISYENTKMSYSGSCQLSKHLCTVPYEKNL